MNNAPSRPPLSFMPRPALLSTMPPTQVALVEDDIGMRERIARVIRADPSLALAHSAGTAREILAWLVDNPIDVLLVDLGLPDRSGLEVIRDCRRTQPACAVMVISIFGDEGNMVQAFEAGASGYLLKDGTEADLATHIRNLRAGGSPMSPVIARQLLRRWQANQPPAPVPAQRPAAPGGPLSPERLSPREFEVLDLVSRGFPYLEVAGRMGVSVTTVQTHIRNIYGKLDVHNKSEAVFEARSLGWLP